MKGGTGRVDWKVAGFVWLGEPKLHLLWLPANGGHILLFRRNVDAQIEHDDLDHVKGKSPGFFEFLIWSKSALLYRFLGSRHTLVYPDDVEELLAQGWQ